MRYTVTNTADRESKTARALLMSKYCPAGRTTVTRQILEGNTSSLFFLPVIKSCVLTGELRDIHQIAQHCPDNTTQECYRAYKAPPNRATHCHGVLPTVMGCMLAVSHSAGTWRPSTVPLILL